MKIFDFIKHYARSNSRHGIHSPFVYALVDRCVYATAPVIPKAVCSYYRELRSDHRLLNGMDFGQDKETEVPISTYARKSTMPDFQAQLLFRLIAYFKPQVTLELGSNLGKSLCAMATAHSEGKFIGVEGNHALVSEAVKALEILNVRNVHVENRTFDEYLDSKETTFDLVFLDGDHRYAQTKNYFQKLKNRMNKEGAIIFHDIYYNSEMKRAWSEIKKDQEVAVTLDLFFFGIVWFDLKQAKEHFSVRFPNLFQGLL